MPWYGPFNLFGPTADERSATNKLKASSDFATGVGEADVTASSDFMRNILSGDPTRIAESLTPEISATQKQVQQQKNSLAEFSPRSGGTAAAAAGADTAGRSNIIDLMGNMRSNAASSLSNVGSSLLTAGMEGQRTLFGEAEAIDPWQKLLELGKAAGQMAGAAAA